MSSPIYTLRLAAWSDVEFLFRVIVSVRLRHEEHDDEDSERFKKSFRRDEGTVWVIQYLGVDVGRLRVIYGRDEIYVGGIQIMPAYQGKGIGSAILKDLIARAHQNDIPVKLEVFEKNWDAYRLYLRLGFTEDAEHQNPGFLSLTYLPH